jgi:hypothetical protein
MIYWLICIVIFFIGALAGIAYLLYRMLGPWWKKGFRL